MEIIEKTPTKLKLYYKTPRPFLFCLLGSLFISVGTIAILLFAKKTTLQCNKTANNISNCQIISTGFVNNTEQTIVTDKLEQAKIQEIEDETADRQIILITATKEITISKEFSFGETEQIDKLRQIKEYIKNADRTELKVSQDNRFSGAFTGICFILLGGGIITIALKNEASEVFYIFDRGAKELEITSKKISNKTAVIKLDFAKIEKAVVKTANKGYRNDRADIYNLELVMPENESHSVYTFIGDDMKATADRIAKDINEFLN